MLSPISLSTCPKIEGHTEDIDNLPGAMNTEGSDPPSLAGFCASLMQIVKAEIWMQQLCHDQRTALHSTPPNPLTLTFFSPFSSMNFISLFSKGSKILFQLHM